MGIYIKGIEMPKNGLYQIVDGTIRLFDYWKIINDKEKDIQSYNIIEIEEPHGRLIDADALADDLEADGQEFGDEMKLNCASWLRSNATPTVIEGSEEEE